MKMILNKRYGGFSISQYIADRIGVNTYDDPNTLRVNEDLINYLEIFGSDNVSGMFARLTLVEIPDDITDYEVNDYDGFETVTYVLDGKLYHA